MRKTRPNLRSAAKEATRHRIVSVAARAIRRRGYEGTGVADIMKEAGLTHGGFYAHFASREALLGEAVQRACTESATTTATLAAAVAPEKALQALLGTYLSQAHCDQAETGCPLAALGSETFRQGPEVRRVFTRHLQAMIDSVARQSPDWGTPAAHERAMVTVSTMVGALLLARAVDEPAISEALRASALKRLTT